MTTYQPYLDFTAQSVTVSALHQLFARFEREQMSKGELTAIVVFIAFAIEAYLNSVGARQIKFWDELERLPWRNKVIILHGNASRSADWGQDPLQFAVEVFKLRDKLAHGKPERVIGPVCSSSSEADKYLSSLELQPDWYQGITREWVAAARGRFRELMMYIGQLYNLYEADHLHSASGGLLIGDQST